jgi:hypothetical protein
MLILSVVFAIYVLASAWYIRRMHTRLRSHEEGWNQIEKLTDHNKEGDVVIHVRHTEH